MVEMKSKEWTTNSRGECPGKQDIHTPQRRKTKTAAPDGHVSNFGDPLREDRKLPGESAAHDCILFDEPSSCVGDVEASSINKIASGEVETEVPLVS